MQHSFKALIIGALLGFTSLANSGEVSRAMFTIGVDNREPVIKVDTIDSSSFNSISFFTELTNFEGQTVSHQWYYDAELMYEKAFEVKGPRWRVWTSKTFIPEWTGTWTVDIVDSEGGVIDSRSFEYQ